VFDADHWDATFLRFSAFSISSRYGGSDSVNSKYRGSDSTEYLPAAGLTRTRAISA